MAWLSEYDDRLSAIHVRGLCPRVSKTLTETTSQFVFDELHFHINIPKNIGIDRTS
jgi:hypothetical protein